MEMGVAPSRFRGRRTTTVYEYDPQGRVVAAVEGSEWTSEDRALLLAYKAHQATLCPGCGHEKADAWHPDNEGWYDGNRYVCHACTAQQHDPDSKGEQKPAVYASAEFTRDLTVRPYPEESP